MFIASGPPAAVSRAIEARAAEERPVSALVVPWESGEGIVNMSITAATGDGWAIEHTNLGTIRLTDLGHGRTRVHLAAAVDLDRPERQPHARLFDRFAQALQAEFQVAS